MNAAKRIRAALHANPDGMTTRELASLVGLRDHRAAQETAIRMPDAYIDRWTKHRDPMGRHIYTPVWCVVVPPENCPRPEARKGKN